MKDFPQIERIGNLKFVIDIIVYERPHTKTNTPVTEERVVIKLMNLVNCESRIHVYTDVLNMWRNCQTNTIKSHADAIVPFLNYLTFELKRSSLQSIDKLTFELGADYLNQYGKDKARSTVEKRLRTLTHFYYYLVKKKVITTIDIRNFQISKSHSGRYTVTCKAISDLVYLPNYSTQTRLHNLDQSLIMSFLLASLRHTPSIALGVYFQMFGGLRVGEVLNTTYSSISTKGPNGDEGMFILLKNRYLRPDVKEQPYCKKIRKQFILPIDDLLSRIFTYHRNQYEQNDTDAIFIDRNGKAMTLSTYRRRFTKLKNAFLQELENSEDIKLKIYAQTLRSQNWFTHIGRGVFSNSIAEQASNVVEIAIKRGDSSLDSSLSYLTDTKALDDKVNAVLSGYYSPLIQEFNKIIR